jgi:S1-C subfamily serine protease
MGSALPAHTAGTENSSGSTNQILQQLSLESQALAQRVSASVAQVRVRRATAVPTTREDLSELFGGARTIPEEDQGSGIVVTADGYLLTNYHVVREATAIEIVLPDRSPLPAQLVGHDALTDLAVLRVDATDLKPITWGDSDAVEVGEFVWAVGNPFGLEGSVSFGILSAKKRRGVTGRPASDFLNDFLQTDAAVNPGNSGGPLIDRNGCVIGINAAILGSSFRGISFAIPGNTARAVFDGIRQTGRIARGWIGVSLDDLHHGAAPNSNVSREGVLVVSLTHRNGDSPAATAGVEAGDVVLAWNDQPVRSAVGLARLIAETSVGQSAKLTILRRDQQLELQVQVKERL